MEQIESNREQELLAQIDQLQMQLHKYQSLLISELYMIQNERDCHYKQKEEVQSKYNQMIDLIHQSFSCLTKLLATYEAATQNTNDNMINEAQKLLESLEKAIGSNK